MKTFQSLILTNLLAIWANLMLPGHVPCVPCLVHRPTNSSIRLIYLGVGCRHWAVAGEYVGATARSQRQHDVTWRRYQRNAGDLAHSSVAMQRWRPAAAAANRCDLQARRFTLLCVHVAQTKEKSLIVDVLLTFNHFKDILLQTLLF